MGWILLLGSAGVSALVVYACCVVMARADRQ